jgi:hypothetical protein
VAEAGCGFSNLGGIAGSIGYAPDESANVISLPKLRDAGHWVNYNADLDVFELQGDTNKYTFAKKQSSGGFKVSSHYSCDMGDEHVFVQTVTENMQQYTRRQVGEAYARDLMERLGYTSTNGLIDRVLNSRVTREHVLRADAIWGPPIAALKGKTVKATPQPLEPVLAPRVVQVQQVLAVDIFFVKGIPFLLGALSTGLLLRKEHQGSVRRDCGRSTA